MKKTFIYKTLVALFLVFSFSSASAQCDPNSFKANCKGQLATGFTYIKSYPLKESKINAKGEIEYSFVFSKGTIYMLTFANNEGDAKDIEITLFDPSRTKVTSNFDEANNQYFPMGYKCTATGVHYMTFKLKNGTAHCGLSILGFKRG